MATAAQQVPVASLAPAADVVGNAFVHQYYLILHKSPELVHRFYQDNSILGRPEENGMLSITTAMPEINKKIVSLDYGNLISEITTVDAQDSYNGGVLVLVTGYMTGKDNLRKKFTQSFFLAPQDTGYYVFNDIFRYVNDVGPQNGNQVSVNDDEAPHTAEQDSSTMLENNVSANGITVADEMGKEGVCNPGNGEVLAAEEEPPVPAVLDEIPDDSQLVESNSKVEEVPRKSYASILSSHHVKASKESVAPLPAPTPAPSKTAPKNQEEVVAAPTPSPVPETVPSGTSVNENGAVQEIEADGYSIYIRGLPFNATHALVEVEFKKFGSIKPNGVQVRFQKGFCFGFVEFEAASAVQSALEASPLLINGHQVDVEEKRSTSRGSGRGRFSSGRGSGYRNEGGRGGRSYGGSRGYGRGDFAGRGDFVSRNGNRGGLANRGGDGYQRVENGGRVNRAEGFPAPAHATTKSTAIRVSASA